MIEFLQGYVILNTGTRIAWSNLSLPHGRLGVMQSSESLAWVFAGVQGARGCQGRP